MVTGGAALKLALPAWLATRMTVPVMPVRVTLLPEIVAGPDWTVTTTGNLEVAVGGTMVNGAELVVFAVMVLERGDGLRLLVHGEAGRHLRRNAVLSVAGLVGGEDHGARAGQCHFAQRDLGLPR